MFLQHTRDLHETVLERHYLQYLVQEAEKKQNDKHERRILLNELEHNYLNAKRQIPDSISHARTGLETLEAFETLAIEGDSDDGSEEMG